MLQWNVTKGVLLHTMKAEHVNAFIQGAQNTFTTFFGEGAELGKVFLKTGPYTPEAVSAEIGIVGSLTGSVFYNLTAASAMAVTSKFMMGMAVTEVDDMTLSAVGELANMVSGQSAAVFFGSGIVVDITPPTVRVSAKPADFPSIGAGQKIFCVPLNLFGGTICFEIDVLMS
jgi:chemotaxis protein CheX